MSILSSGHRRDLLDGSSPREMTLFVGREREAARIARELGRGRHVIVSGPYGIGRTSLLRRLSGSMSAHFRFVFVDFERPSADMERHLFQELFPRRARRQSSRKLRGSSAGFRVTSWTPDDPRHHVLVLDNVAFVSRRKLALAGALVLTRRYTLVAIVESFLPPSHLERLRTRLTPAPIVTLGRLSTAATRRYFALASDRYHLGWSVDRIAGKVMATGGYPLAMWEAVSAARGKAGSGQQGEIDAGCSELVVSARGRRIPG